MCVAHGPTSTENVISLMARCKEHRSRCTDQGVVRRLGYREERTRVSSRPTGRFWRPMRSSGKHVVQVQQAIHLLLAFDLFVIVLAVDARRLHRAVGQAYLGQLAEPDQPVQRDCATREAGFRKASPNRKVL